MPGQSTGYGQNTIFLGWNWMNIHLPTSSHIFPQIPAILMFTMVTWLVTWLVKPCRFQLQVVLRPCRCDVANYLLGLEQWLFWFTLWTGWKGLDLFEKVDEHLWPFNRHMGISWPKSMVAWVLNSDPYPSVFGNCSPYRPCCFWRSGKLTYPSQMTKRLIVILHVWMLCHLNI